jgi:hypothetical protein
VPNNEESSMVPVLAGLLFWALAWVLGLAAVSFSPIIVWPAATGDLLPFSSTALAWLEIFSLPGCILLGVTAFGACELGSQFLRA